MLIPYSKHFIDKDDIDSVCDVLKNKSITQGELVSTLEKKICKYTNAKYAIAVTSCSAGLHLSLNAINIEKKNVITSPISFVSTASSILLNKGKLNFSDISEKNINIDLDKFSKISKIHAIVPVHFSGVAVELDIFRMKFPKVKIVEDSAHALGARYKNGVKIGSCKYSDLSVFSLHPAKTITAGEGGIITTNNKQYYDKLSILRNNGVEKRKSKFMIKKNSNNQWYYEVQQLGYHYRITDIQCALALSQFKKINLFLNKRKKIAEIYDREFKSFKNLYPAINSLERKNSSNHLYVVRVNFNKIKKSRKKVMNILKSKGIITQVHYIPIFFHPYYKNFYKNKYNFHNTICYYEEALSLPIYYSLSEKDQEKVINILKKEIG